MVEGKPWLPEPGQWKGTWRDDWCVMGQETTGAGGFFMAARSIPVLARYCKVIRELAPNAWIFNFTNSSGLVTQAMRTLGYDRVIGICDSPSSTKMRIAEAMG